MTELASVVLFSRQPGRAIAFYQALGVGFELEDHGDGMVHAATDLGGVHIAIVPASDVGSAEASESSRPPQASWRDDGSTFVGFFVPSLEPTVSTVRSLGCNVLVEHEVRDWGCRAVVVDPDGRAVELNQAGHCGAGVSMPDPVFAGDLANQELRQTDIDIYDQPIGVRLLFKDPKSGAEHYLIRYPAGLSAARHTHSAAHTFIVLEGDLQAGGERFGPGSYCHFPAGVPMQHGPAGDDGCLFLAIFDGPQDVQRLGG